MQIRHRAIVLLAGLLAVGCSHDPYRDAYFDMLNAEKRVLEDRLYEAEDNYEQAYQELQACRARQPQDAPPRSQSPQSVQPPADEPDLPDVELPPGFNDSAGRRGDRRTSAPSTFLASAPIRPQEPVSEAPPQEPIRDSEDEPPTDRRVASVYLNPRRTGGLDLDGRPGDDGLAVLLEPRNELGQYLADPGSLSIVLLDPAKEGDAARFARWDFDPEATARMMSAQGFDRGLLVRVPWPDQPPDSERLHLFARYTDAEGISVEADREIVLNARTLLADRWTPRAVSEATRTASRPASEQSPVVQATHEAPLTTEIPARHKTGATKPIDDRRPGSLWQPQRNNSSPR